MLEAFGGCLYCSMGIKESGKVVHFAGWRGSETPASRGDGDVISFVNF